MATTIQLPDEVLILGASKETALPVCLPPWLENPYRLVSLWDMLQFNADVFAANSGRLMKFWVGLRRGATLDDFGTKELGGTLGELQRECEKHGFRSSLNQIRRIEEYINRGMVPSEELGQLALRIQEDLQGEMFLHVPTARVHFYESKEPLFGAEVATCFPSVSFDMVEAGKCHALHRSTSCVFHLMRVLESGLKVFAAQFNLPTAHTEWGKMIEGIEKAVRGMATDPSRAPDWKDKQEFFSQAATNFSFFKDAWRNYTMHARGKYTEDEAEAIFGNVRAFMQKLATRFHE
jgi:hypothetical protein